MTVKSTKKQKKKIDKALVFYIAMLAFPVLQFCVFYIGVNFNSVLLSFREYSLKEGKYLFLDLGNLFANYKQFFFDIGNDMVLRYALRNSLIIWFITPILITPVSILFSFYLFKKRFMSGFFKVMLFLPTIVPGIVLVLVYMYFVDGGIPILLNDWFGLRVFGLLYTPDTAFWMVALFLFLTGFGTDMLLYTGAMSRVDQSIIESCHIDGGNALHELWYIILPSIYPTLTMQMVFGVAGFFTNQAALLSFYGVKAPSQIQTIGYWLFIKVAADTGTYSEYPYASAAGIIFTFVAAPITLLVKNLLEKHGPSEE